MEASTVDQESVRDLLIEEERLRLRIASRRSSTQMQLSVMTLLMAVMIAFFSSARAEEYAAFNASAQQTADVYEAAEATSAAVAKCDPSARKAAGGSDGDDGRAAPAGQTDPQVDWSSPVCLAALDRVSDLQGKVASAASGLADLPVDNSEHYLIAVLVFAALAALAIGLARREDVKDEKALLRATERRLEMEEEVRRRHSPWCSWRRTRRQR